MLLYLGNYELTKIETNVITKPSIQTVMKIAKGLGVSIKDLIQ